MGTLTRERIIDELTSRVDSHSSGLLSDTAKARAVTRRTLSSYSTELLIELHMSANDPEETSATYRFAKEGKSERWMRTWILLREDYEHLFAGSRHYHVGPIDSYINSFSLYPELTYEETEAYYGKVIALVGVVNAIQYELKDSEGYYFNYTQDANPRLLNYFNDPEDEDGVDKIMRIASPDLTALILSRPDDWEKIAKIVTDRQTDDAEFIRSVLDGSKVFSIADGRL